jgi:hypothetical protein
MDPLNDPGQLLSPGEHSQYLGNPEQFGWRLIAEQSGKRPVGCERCPVGSYQTQPDRGAVGQGAKLLLGLAESVLHPAVSRHRVPQVAHLLPEGNDFVDELLFGAVLIPHTLTMGEYSWVVLYGVSLLGTI